MSCTPLPHMPAWYMMSQTQNGNAHGYVFEPFNQWFPRNWIILDRKIALSLLKKKNYFNQTWALMLLHLEPPVSLLAEQACPWWVYEQQKGCQNKTATTPMSSWLSVTQISSWLGHGGWDQSSEVRVQLPERQAMMCLYMCLNYKGRYIHFHLTLGLQGRKN